MGVKLYNEIEERFIKYVEEHQSELYTCLSELVKIDTVNYKTYGNENNGQDYLEKICKGTFVATHSNSRSICENARNLIKKAVKV
mgnify:CR=1 FL=1